MITRTIRHDGRTIEYATNNDRSGLFIRRRDGSWGQVGAQDWASDRAFRAAVARIERNLNRPPR